MPGPLEGIPSTTNTTELKDSEGDMEKREAARFAVGGHADSGLFETMAGINRAEARLVRDGYRMVDDVDGSGRPVRMIVAPESFKPEPVEEAAHRERIRQVGLDGGPITERDEIVIKVGPQCAKGVHFGRIRQIGWFDRCEQCGGVVRV